MIKLSDDYQIKKYNHKENVYGLYHTRCASIDPLKGVCAWSDIPADESKQECRECGVTPPSLILDRFNFITHNL